MQCLKSVISSFFAHLGSMTEAGRTHAALRDFDLADVRFGQSRRFRDVGVTSAYVRRFAAKSSAAPVRN
jgi:hypothetical protein